jgi:EmrB/QacA subfamily drug resistance transporter
MAARRADAPAQERLSLRGNGIILLEMAFIALMVMFIEIMLVPALPGIAMQYPEDAEWVSWVLSAYLLVGAVATPIIGRLGDMYGKKRVMVLSMVAYTIGLIGCGLSWSLPSLIAFRALQGVGMGIFPLAYGIVRDTFPSRMIPMAIGIISSMFSIGVSIGLLGGGWIVETYDWKTAFDVVWPLMALTTLLVFFTIKESPVRKNLKLDWLGTFLLGGGVFVLLFDLTQGEEWGWTEPVTIGMFILSAVLIVSFIFWEKRIKNPIVSMRLMAHRGIAGANFAALFVGLGMFMLFQSLPYFLMSSEAVGGLAIDNTFTVGLYMFPSAVAQLLFAPMIGRWSRKIGADATLAIGMVLMTIGYGLIVLFHANELQIMATMFVFGAGLGFAMVSLISVVAMASPKQDFGVASGMNTLFRIVGGSVGPVIGAAIMATFVVSMNVGPVMMDVTSEDGYVWTWIAGMAFCLVGFLVTVMFRPGKGLDYENEVDPE